MNARKSIARMGMLVPLAGVFLVASSSVNAADVPDSEQVSKLLSEAKTLAFQLKEDASVMEGYTRMNVSVESHAAAINQVRDHVNALGRQVETGSLYPALHRLEAQGWIAASWELSDKGKRARYYRLTQRGRKQLVTEQSKWEAFSRAMGLILSPALNRGEQEGQ